MTPTSLGRVNVPTPGTPVHLATSRTPCCRIRVQVIKELWPNQAGGVDDSYEVWSSTDSDTLDLSDYWIDAAIAGEGLIVSYWNKPSYTYPAG